VLLDRPGGGAGAGGMQEDDYASYTPPSGDSGAYGRNPAKPVFDKKVEDEIPF